VPKHGKSSRVYVDGYNLSAYLTNVSNPGNCDTAETTTFSSSDKTYVAGVSDGTLRAEGLFDSSTAGAFRVLNAALGGADKLWCWMPEDSTGSGLAFGAKCIANAFEVTSPVAGVVAATAGGQSVVGMELLEILQPLTTRTGTSGAGTKIDHVLNSTKGGAAYIQVTAVTGTLTALVQASCGGSTWDTLTTFTNAIARTAERKAITGNIKSNTRIGYSFASTADTATFFVGLHRQG